MSGRVALLPPIAHGGETEPAVILPEPVGCRNKTDKYITARRRFMQRHTDQTAHVALHAVAWQSPGAIYIRHFRLRAMKPHDIREQQKRTHRQPRAVGHSQRHVFGIDGVEQHVTPLRSVFWETLPPDFQDFIFSAHISPDKRMQHA
nr:hypothetical protein [uncultured Duncaniella sp.]